MTHPRPLWTPEADRILESAMEAFREFIQRETALAMVDYWALQRWSVAEPARFWELCARHFKLKWRTRPEEAYRPGPSMRSGTWFPGGTLNYAEHLLAPARDDEIAIVAIAEGASTRQWRGDELRAAVARCQEGLRRAGVTKGDRVAGVVANTAEAVIAMLAATGLGAIWASCSPDFGANGIVDRFGQIAPKVLFYTSGYQYNGKFFDCGATIADALAKMPSVTLAVSIDHVKRPASPQHLTFDEWLAAAPASARPVFEPMAFSDPLFILFSSGTTGIPKCIVHSVGGTLLQHLKELSLHSDMKPGDRLLYFTTCGWMMWNWMVSALAVGTRLVLFEGSVSYPDMGVLWRAVSDQKVTHFGTSPKFLGATMKAGFQPAKLELGALRTMLSTGSPLLPEHFEWVYREVKADVHLASISGGTDIISCFMLGVPTLPVYQGEIQAPGLGMAVEAWESEGKPVVGQKGELVCTRPFVSMPVGFWNDPKGEKYRQAYFDFYEHADVWRHGDYIEVTPRGGIVVYGRSDATLNPGGVRIGTAEIYRQAEAIPGVVDSLAVGRETGDDVEIWLFVKLAPGVAFDTSLEQMIKARIKQELTPRHVPRRVLPVKDIPYTRSGKKVELAVRQAIHGEPVANVGALANPEALEEYYALRD